MDIRPLYLESNTLFMLDQRLLPGTEKWLEYHDAAGVAEGIRDMVVRGAPAIGIAAAFGIALESLRTPPDQMQNGLHAAGRLLTAARPTAVNLFWAVERMLAVADALAGCEADTVRSALMTEADRILTTDVEMNRAIGRHGASLIGPKSRIMTHCNAGALATGGYGTALGVIRAAREAGLDPSVISCETRPYLQGARLTAWELVRDGFDVTLITDNSAGWQMASKKIDCVVVGADRIAANGDTANKIGTFTHAVLAARFGIPFYVAAPSSTLDPGTADGTGIRIEERSPEEVVSFGGVRVAAAGVKVLNPSFDVTPWQLITAIITERGVHRPGPDGYGFDSMVAGSGPTMDKSDAEPQNVG